MNTRGYRPGDRLYYRNSYGQDLYAAIVRKTATMLVVKRDEWPSEEAIDLDNYVRHVHFRNGKAI